ncbi:hypothetical protein [Microlunatus sp. Gsoil 973]|uniref:hypothetical protein n=1 Tax=Microlunatus sp. Gsoil 973 TaxID=2672569 RepID=UPI0012B48EC5|nr:hypothetical protein [Microlunatus sp. Gsoil 973]QGN31477.1 hypothetical protein GJV80_00025 [Microlunatus sp. Gsoil 973]
MTSSRRPAGENQRRKTARDWAKDHADRNWLEKGWDSVFGGDDPPAVDISDTGPLIGEQADAEAAEDPCAGFGWWWQWRHLVSAPLGSADLRDQQSQR